MDELVEARRAGQVTQAVLAEVPQVRTLRQRDERLADR